MWRITYSEAVEGDVARLAQSVRVQIVKAINSKLKTNPEIFGKPLCKPQHGKWSLRVGDYRVIYELENETHLMKITAIGHRRDIYEQ